jgi:WhiB family redox-sensing transcriptional regulator
MLIGLALDDIHVITLVEPILAAPKVVRSRIVWNVLGEGALTLESGVIDPRSNVLSLFASQDDPEPPWQHRALCAQTDPEAFFPEKGGSTREAKRVCASCEVRAECLEYALDNDERFGIWGGYSERERRKLKQRRSLS